MDSKPARPDSQHTDAPPKPEPVQLLRGDAVEQLRHKMESDVRDHAYRIYQEKGETNGRDLGQWLEAEGKLVSSNLELRESGSWFHCNCPVHGIRTQQIQVGVDSTQFIIYLDDNSSSDHLPPDAPNPIFYWAKWPEKVDPSTAAAYFLDSRITIEVKKADPPEPNSPVKPVNNPIR